MKFALLSSLPSATIQLVYAAEVGGVTFEDVILVGHDGPEQTILWEYARIKGFRLHFVSDPNSALTVDLVCRLGPDVLAQIGSLILRESLLRAPRLGVVNLHAGWLPDYRGLDSAEWAVLEGGRLGCTAHVIDPGIDTGPLLLRRELSLLPGDTFRRILARNHHQLKWQTLVDALAGVRDGRLAPIEQHPAQGRQYFAMHPRIRALAEEVLARRCARLEKAA